MARLTTADRKKYGLILTPQEVTIERAVGLIKRGFSHRLASKFPVWQRGFTDHRIRDAEDMETRRRYLHMNPVRVGWSRRRKSIDTLLRIGKRVR